jgi:putative membrane protein
LLTFSAQAQENNGTPTRIGRLNLNAFNAINENGNRMVAAVTATNTALSEADQQLLMQVAAGGQRQLAISRAVLEKVTNPQVKLLAQSEVEEQTGVSAKLQEIASAKGITLPAGPDAEAQAMVSQAQNLSGAQLDLFYLNESGIRGHELLRTTMQTVQKTAKDESLKRLATATLPVIRTHLSVSQDVKAAIGTGTSAAQ